MDAVSAQREICRPFSKAPRSPITDASTGSAFFEKLHVRLPSVGDAIALRAMHVSSKYSVWIPVRPKGPREVRGAFRSLRIAIFGMPKSMQMADGV